MTVQWNSVGGLILLLGLVGVAQADMLSPNGGAAGNTPQIIIIPGNGGAANGYAPVPPQAAPPAQAQLPLAVSAWVNRANNLYQLGEPVVLTVQTNEDAFITILNVGSSGRVQQVFPNNLQPDNRVAANQPTMIGGPGSRFAIIASSPPGTETIRVIASRYAVSLPRASSGDLNRDLSVALNSVPGNHWSETSVMIQTYAQPAQPAQPQHTVPLLPQQAPRVNAFNQGDWWLTTPSGLASR